MKVVIGIGNPGPEYADTRHNVGYMVVEKAALKLGASFGLSPWRALAAHAHYAGNKVTLLKPLTFVNLSGETARLATRSLSADPTADLLVVHDDADIEPGTIRFRSGGGTAGHNGLNSIAQAVGEGFARLRIGIGRTRQRLRDHVLSQFSPQELPAMNEAVERASAAVLDWVARGLTWCQNTYNRRASNLDPHERS